MKIPVIKTAVENFSLEQLKKAEEELYNESPLSIEVQGEDEGEQLTHVLAAIWIKEEISKTGEDFKTVLRKYTQRVRSSIS